MLTVTLHTLFFQHWQQHDASEEEPRQSGTDPQQSWTSVWTGEPAKERSGMGKLLIPGQKNLPSCLCVKKCAQSRLLTSAGAMCFSSYNSLPHLFLSAVGCYSHGSQRTSKHLQQGSAGKTDVSFRTISLSRHGCLLLLSSLATTFPCTDPACVQDAEKGAEARHAAVDSLAPSTSPWDDMPALLARLLRLLGFWAASG